jgi:putative ABC transport system ATP-binding protein
MKTIEILKQIEFTYPKDDKYIYCIPKGIQISSHKTYSILGISGSGKSTILTLLAALHRFRAGTIRYTFTTQNAYQTIKVSSATWKKFIGPRFWGKIGFSFQNPELLQPFTVKENLQVALGKAHTEEMALAAFDQKEWDDIKDSPVWKLSGGQKQRIGIIRAFGVNQSVVFMDEPTNNLDKSNRARIVDFIHKYQKDRSIIIVSHDKDFMDMLNIDTIFEVREEGELHKRNQRILQILQSQDDVLLGAASI